MTGALVVLWIALFDVLAGLLFPAPGALDASPGTLRRYFEYGRSTEAKLRNMAPPNREPAVLARIGWLGTPMREPQPARASGPGRVLIAAYGQSFTAHIMKDAAALDDRLELRLLGGPSAPLSHSFKMYQDDRGHHQAKIAVLGVLASTLPQLATMTTMTWGFEVPSPYTYPRYTVEAGQLQETAPLLNSLSDLREALADADHWHTFRTQLAEHDAAFDPLVFDADVFDRSVVGRLSRRAFGQRNQHRFDARFHRDSGFTNEEGILDVAEALLAEFAASARRDRIVPFVLLFNDRGYADHLYRALGPKLRARGVPFLSSHEIAPPSDAQTFIPDGHFRPELDRQIAEAWLAQIRPVLQPE